MKQDLIEQRIKQVSCLTNISDAVYSLLDIIQKGTTEYLEIHKQIENKTEIDEKMVSKLLEINTYILDIISKKVDLTEMAMELLKFDNNNENKIVNIK